MLMLIYSKICAHVANSPWPDFKHWEFIALSSMLASWIHLAFMTFPTWRGCSYAATIYTFFLKLPSLVNHSVLGMYIGDFPVPTTSMVTI